MKDSRSWEPWLFFLPFGFCMFASNLSIADPLIIMAVIACIVMGFVFSFSEQTKGPREYGKYQKPTITDVHMMVRNGYQYGVFYVDSSHSEHVIRDLKLPSDATVTIIKRNAKYMISFPINDDGLTHNWKTESNPDGVTQRDLTLWQVRDWAKANGYEGQVRQWQ